MVRQTERKKDHRARQTDRKTMEESNVGKERHTFFGYLFHKPPDFNDVHKIRNICFI